MSKWGRDHELLSHVLVQLKAENPPLLSGGSSLWNQSHASPCSSARGNSLPTPALGVQCFIVL